jgi:hypothetical protein
MKLSIKPYLKYWWIPVVLVIFLNFSKWVKVFFSTKKDEEEKINKGYQDALNKIDIPVGSFEKTEAELLGILSFIWAELNSVFYISGKNIIEQLQGLKPEEIDYITKEFGTKDYKLSYLRPAKSLTLFGIYDLVLWDSERKTLEEVYKDCILAYEAKL